LIQGKAFIGDMIQYRKNGEKYWNLLRITPVRDVTGNVTHYVGVKNRHYLYETERFRD